MLAQTGLQDGTLGVERVGPPTFVGAGAPCKPTVFAIPSSLSIERLMTPTFKKGARRDSRESNRIQLTRLTVATPAGMLF